MKNKKDDDNNPEALGEKYLESLETISNLASKTSRSVSHSLDILTENLEIKVQKIKLLSSQAVYAIQEISIQTKVKIIAFGASMFLLGALFTSLLYNVFVTNVMNKYLYKTIEKLSEKPVNEAKKEAERILTEANIKADGMLKNTKDYVLKRQKGDEKNE